jgi:hypothetical protein
MRPPKAPGRAGGGRREVCCSKRKQILRNDNQQQQICFHRDTRARQDHHIITSTPVPQYRGIAHNIGNVLDHPFVILHQLREPHTPFPTFMIKAL